MDNNMPQENDSNQKLPSFLGLPAEIRTKILKMLLWQSEPIRTRRVSSTEADEAFNIFPDKKFDFHPNILRTCHLLKKEGEEHLYNNTLVILLWRPHSSEDIMTVLDQSTEGKLSSYYIHKFKKLHVELFFWDCDQDGTVEIDEYECELRRSQISGLAQYLAYSSNVKNLVVSIKRGKRGYDNDNSIGENFLLPLMKIRVLESVDFEGVSVDFARGISSLMMAKSDRPDEIIRTMCKLENTMYGLNMSHDMVNEVTNSAQLAIFQRDWGLFQQHKKQIMYYLVARLCKRLKDTGETAGDVFRMLSAEFGGMTNDETNTILDRWP